MSDHVAVTDPCNLAEAQARIRAITERQAAAAARLDQKQRAALASEMAEMQARLNAIAERDRELCAAASSEDVRLRDPRRIMAQTALRFGLTLADITGQSRHHHVVRARWAAIAAIHDANPEMSISQIGRHVGNRDHTSARNALAKMAKQGVPQPTDGIKSGDAR